MKIDHPIDPHAPLTGPDRRSSEFEVQFRLDAKRPKSPRMFFRDRVYQSRMNVTARATKAERWCQEMVVYVEVRYCRNAGKALYR